MATPMRSTRCEPPSACPEIRAYWRPSANVRKLAKRAAWRPQTRTLAGEFDGSGVRPVELVIDPVGVGEVQAEALGFDLERPDAALALLPDEAVGQDDVSHVGIAGHRILEGVTGGAPDA